VSRPPDSPPPDSEPDTDDIEQAETRLERHIDRMFRKQATRILAGAVTMAVPLVVGAAWAYAQIEKVPGLERRVTAMEFNNWLTCVSLNARQTVDEKKAIELQFNISPTCKLPKEASE
jgi:hypothetical protein